MQIKRITRDGKTYLQWRAPAYVTDGRGNQTVKMVTREVEVMDTGFVPVPYQNPGDVWTAADQNTFLGGNLQNHEDRLVENETMLAKGLGGAFALTAELASGDNLFAQWLQLDTDVVGPEDGQVALTGSWPEAFGQILIALRAPFIVNGTIVSLHRFTFDTDGVTSVVHINVSTGTTATLSATFLGIGVRAAAP